MIDLESSWITAARNEISIAESATDRFQLDVQMCRDIAEISKIVLISAGDC